MRILMLSRKDVYQVIGGDTIQMDETKKCLEKLGLSVQSCPVEEASDLSGFDVVHLFNWEQLEPFLERSERRVNGGTPLVLSTIFWYHTGHWFDQAARTTRPWRLAQAVLGAGGARQIYERWQEHKFRSGEQGKRLRRNLTFTGQLLPNSRIEIEHLDAVLGLRGIPQHCYTVVPNGIALEMFDPLPAPNADFQKEYGLTDFVLQVGRIQAAKNQLGLIQALEGTSIPIVFVGQPSPYEQDYVRRCHELGEKRGNVFFIGPKPVGELVGIYTLAAVHVLPSWRETPGLVSLEAAASGCQVVSTAIGSAREYFGDLAWYCNPRKPDSIRKAVLQALAAPRTDALRQRVLERFTWDSAAQKTLEAYQKVLR